MLEAELRKWACLTKDDRIRVVYNEITSTTETPICIPDYQPGQLNFVRCDYKCREVLLEEQREAAKAGPGFSVFEGSGATIRKPRY
ncbi:unnamed protein product, partial [Mesorhabditis spiculigera]